MLAIPSHGVSHSVHKHNCDIETICDWIEASVLFSPDGKVSITDIVDSLIDNGIYEEQSFAREFIEDCFQEIERHITWLGKVLPLSISGQKITRTVKSWKNSSGYSYCLVLSLAAWFPEWAISDKDYNRQGLLFENLTAECLAIMFNGWNVLPTGWARGRARKIHKVVHAVAAAIGESIGDVELVDKEENEAGLDIVCYRPFRDGRVGIPVYLVQCASGKNYHDKLQTPNMKIWGKIVAFTYTPKRAFATPFAFIEDRFRKLCNRADGLLLDRCRLLSAGHNKRKWLTPKLSAEINKWLLRRIKSLPSDD